MLLYTCGRFVIVCMWEVYCCYYCCCLHVVDWLYNGPVDYVVLMIVVNTYTRDIRGILGVAQLCVAVTERKHFYDTKKNFFSCFKQTLRVKFVT